MKHKLISVLLLGFLQACQTTTKQISFKAPAEEFLTFGTCKSSDGGGQFDFFEAEKRLISARLDWLSSQDGHLHIELSDPFALTFLSLQTSRSFILQSSQFEELPVLKIDSQGFMLFDGYFVGIKYYEIGCMLNFTLPKEWKRGLKQIHGTKNNLYYLSKHSKRRLFIDIELVNKKVQKVCSKIEWSNYWFWSSTLEWCFNIDSGLRSLKFDGAKDYRFLLFEDVEADE